MPDGLQVKIEGMEELDKALRRLPDRVQKRVLKTALRAGARVIVKDAKNRVPVDSGTLKKSIKVVSGKSKKGPQATARVFVTTGREAWYSHLIEFGTVKKAARPFLRPAFDSTQTEQIQAIGKKLAAGIEKEADKV